MKEIQMAVRNESPATTIALHPLSKREIDRRIEGLISEIAGQGLAVAADSRSSSSPLRPRWITPRELIDKVSRFLSCN